MGYLKDFKYVALDGRDMGLGPAMAIKKLLIETGEKLENFDLFEINEAFAVQVLACLKLLKGIPLDKLNVNGGSIALGHPVGASGARIVLTLLKELKRQNKRRGIASLCVGGGQGAACSLELY